ncbi:salicylate hydroxylase [Xylariales sp. PMI_506]|nr:salicylate hydroxylase [Xylariales sp. PMI_506]
MPESKILVAIIGGGLAGATLANALIQIPHLDVFVYEAAPEFSERGAAVGLSSNAQAALEQIFPSAKDLLSRAGAVAMNSSRLMMGSGPSAGSVLLDMAGADPGVAVHRASLLRELLAPLPEDRLRPNKKLSSIKESEGKLEVTFQDGESAQFHAVIGADGIFSTVRRHVLQEAADECGPSPAGFWDCRVLVPFEKAKAALGEEYFEQDRQYGWLGDGGFIMHDVLDNRESVQCVISALEKDPPKDRKRPLTRELLDDTLKNWANCPVSAGAKELLLDQDQPQAYSQWEHKKTPTYANGRVCLVGDAAHATTPWQGAGAGQAFEDAMVLSMLLKAIKSAKDIDAAFKTFDIVRRPRCQQVIDSSRGTGNIICGNNDDTQQDADKIRAALASRWNFIFGLDFAKYRHDALETMQELLQVSSD